jgi:hypothetical protein
MIEQIIPYVSLFVAYSVIIILAIRLKQWYFARMQEPEIEDPYRGRILTISNLDDPNNPRIYHHIAYITTYFDRIEARRGGDSHTVVLPLKLGDLVDFDGTQSSYVEYCANGCEDPLTAETRVVWNNDQVVCEECDRDASESDRN